MLTALLLDSPYGLILILLFPLVAFLIQILVGNKLPRKGDWVSIGAVLCSALLSILMFVKVAGLHTTDFRRNFSLEWINLGDSFIISIGLLFDNVTAIMLFVVTVISSLIHIYSVGYMHNDPRYSRFFAYLSLFTFSMLWLVVSDNLLGLYIGWELVGVSSYFLIGFWFEKKSAANACKKAFITNRVGDIGMFIGILMIFALVDSFRFEDAFSFVKLLYGETIAVPFGDGMISYMTVAGLLLFLGAVGKSAQFPLHVWLPDAMEGPTPVSALIHAATMVAAGVYMVTRLFLLFSPSALIFIAYTGGFTAVFAASIAITQTDIKRVLAYSTISQLGYMMLGLGSGGYTAGFYHLWTHAFFKALLFLGAGSVIHAIHSQNLFEMGGLRKKMPWTFATMLVATLAISGVPPFSGFYSKDEILAHTIDMYYKYPTHVLLPIFGFVGAGMTAFYMFRMLFLAFSGKSRNHHAFEHAHESPNIMVMPLIVLASLSIFSTGFPFNTHWFRHFIEMPNHIDVTITNVVPHEFHSKALYISMPIVIISIFLSTITYLIPKINARWFAEKFFITKLLYKCSYNKWFVDEIYSFLIIRPVKSLARLLAAFDLHVIDELVNATGVITKAFSWISGWFDLLFVDGLVNATATILHNAGSALSLLQSGKIRSYLVLTMLGALLLIALFIFIF